MVLEMAMLHQAVHLLATIQRTLGPKPVSHCPGKVLFAQIDASPSFYLLSYFFDSGISPFRAPPSLCDHHDLAPLEGLPHSSLQSLPVIKIYKSILSLSITYGRVNVHYY